MKHTTNPASAKRSGIAGILVKLVLIALLIDAGITLYNLQSQIQAGQAQPAELTARAQSLEDENNALRADIAAAGDQEKLEDVARDELGMVQSGEKVFYDTHS